MLSSRTEAKLDIIAREMETFAPYRVTEGRLLRWAAEIRNALAMDAAEERPPDVVVEN
jgi:hypothetical protein